MATNNQFCVYSYNLHGFNQGSVLLHDLCCHIRPPVIFLQETWLSSVNLDKLRSFSVDYYCIASSAMENIIETGVLRGRPFGGLAILIHRDLSDNVVCLASSERYIIVKLGSVIFVNVYAPTASKLYDRYSVTLQMLSDISEVLSTKSMHDIVIFGGDLNSHLINSNDAVALLFHDFFHENNILLCNMSAACEIKYTFANAAMNQFSCIDYFAVSDQLMNQSGCNILDILDIEPNHSDHLPIRITLPLDKLSLCTGVKPPSVSNADSNNIMQLRWDHADLLNYYSVTNAKLFPIKAYIDSLYSYLLVDGDNIIRNVDIDRSMYVTAIENTYAQITEILNSTAQQCVPSVPKNFFKHWWDQELDVLKQLSISSHREWVRQGRPKQGPVFVNRTKHKYSYKNAISQKRRVGENAFSNDLHDALLSKDQGSFWKMWKSKFSKNKSKLPNQVEGLINHEEIANRFAEHFADVCRPNSNDKDNEFKDNYFKALDETLLSSGAQNYVFNVDDVDKAVSELKRGKAASLDGLTAEHIQACHPIIISILVKLFNMMLLFEYVPDAFGNGLSIPLPKNLSGPMNSVDAYRCITVSPVLSKVFEKCLLEKLQNYLSSSTLQFGFKKKMSCSHAIYTLSTSVDYFANNLSTVNICTIDLSKAFDKLNIHCLLVKMINRNVPLQFVKLLHCWYSKVFITVKWAFALSKSVKLLAGVRQGGILSPFLFLIYVDDVIIALESSRIGCVIKGFYVGVIMYADDIVLISPSVSDLQFMLHLCYKMLKDIDMCINATKTTCTRIGSRFRNKCSELVICGQTLTWVSCVRYLGIYIESGRYFKVDLAKAKRKFFVCCNSIFSKVNPGRADIVLPLISSYCVPILLYGLEAVILTKTDVTRLEHPFTMIFHKIFGTYSNSIISQCQYFTGCLPLYHLCKSRQLCFLKRIIDQSNENAVCRFLCETFAFRNFETIAAKYNITINDSVTTIKHKIWSTFCSSVEL